MTVCQYENLTRSFEFHASTRSGREVALNGDNQRFGVLCEPSAEDLGAALQAFTERRFQEQVFRLSGPPVRDPVTGKDVLPLFLSGSSNHRLHFRYLSAQALKRHVLPDANVNRLSTEIKSLEIGQQQQLAQKIAPVIRSVCCLSHKSFRSTIVFDDLVRNAIARYQPLSLIDRIIACVRGDERDSPFSADTNKYFMKELSNQAVAFLAHLVQGKWLLLPASCRIFRKSGHRRLLLDALTKRGDPPTRTTMLIEALQRASTPGFTVAGKARRVRGWTPLIVCCTDAEDIDDFSSGLLDAIATAILTSIHDVERIDDGKAWGLQYRLQCNLQGLVLLAAERDSSWQLFYHVRDKNAFRRRTKPRDRKLSTDFKWAQKHSRLSAWRALFSKYLNTKRSDRSTAIGYLNVFLEYLMTIPETAAIPYSPEELDARMHIQDIEAEYEGTFFDYLDNLLSRSRNPRFGGQPLKTTTKNRIGSELRAFFVWYQQENNPAFHNPVDPHEFTFGMHRQHEGRTSRLALPDIVIKTIRDILLPVDKQTGQRDYTFSWSQEALPTQHVMVVDRQTGTGQVCTAFYPGLPILLFLLTVLPLRSFQARWLDSGFGDHKIFDFETGSFVPNPRLADDSANRSTARLQGVIREISDAGRILYGTWVTTNKTAVSDVAKGIRGYAIPFMPPEFLECIRILREWRERYMIPNSWPIEKPVLLYNGQRREFPERTAKRLPSFYPLFADATADVPFDRPISYEKLRSFYDKVLGEVERRLKADNRLPMNLVEWADEQRTKVKRSLVDLHTLRVTGITALYEIGIPIEFISEFVAGHATILMTIYYKNRGPAALRDLLAGAHARLMAQEYDEDGFARFQFDPDYVDEYLFHNDAFDGVDSRSAFQEAGRTGVYRVTGGGDGICPGRLCREGGWDFEANRPTYVEGGDCCCGNCRFWGTGPVFTIGQWASLNCLMLECHNLSAEIVDGRRAVRRLRHEIEGEEPSVRVRVKLRQAEDRISGLETQLVAKLREWGGRYKLFLRSVEKLREYQATRQSDTSNQIVAYDADGEIAVSTMQASVYELLHSVTLQAELAPEFGVHRPAVVQLEHAIVELLDRNNLEQYFLRLEEKDRLTAVNLFMEAILQAPEVGHGNMEKIDAIFSGELPLASLPNVHRGVGQVISQFCQTEAHSVASSSSPPLSQ